MKQVLLAIFIVLLLGCGDQGRTYCYRSGVTLAIAPQLECGLDKICDTLKYNEFLIEVKVIYKNMNRCDPDLHVIFDTLVGNIKNLSVDGYFFIGNFWRKKNLDTILFYNLVHEGESRRRYKYYGLVKDISIQQPPEAKIINMHFIKPPLDVPCLQYYEVKYEKPDGQIFTNRTEKIYVLP